jgi:hypothetical protein
VFKALDDATRLRILGLLLTSEVCVCDIHESLKIPQPKASRHLAYPRARDWSRRGGRDCGFTIDWGSSQSPCLPPSWTASATR